MRNEKRNYSIVIRGSKSTAVIDVITASKLATVAESGKTVEITTNPAHGAKSFETLEKLASTLKSVEFVASDLYVRHDVTDLNVDQFRNLLALYQRFESTIDAITPNRHSKSKSLANLNLVAVSKSETVDALAKTVPADSHVSFESFATTGAVEFRRVITFEPNELSNWVTLSQLFVERARADAKKVAVSAKRNEINFRQLKKVLTRETPSQFTDLFRAYAKTVAPATTNA